jgi:hypothetical protein
MIELTTKNQLPLCPHCGGNTTHRTRRHGPIEWFLHHLLFRSPYRCQDCYERFFSSRLPRPDKKELHHHPA